MHSVPVPVPAYQPSIPATTLALLENIAFLEQYNELFLKDEERNTQCQIVDIHGNFVLNIDMYGRRRTVCGETVNFLDRNGEILFNSDALCSSSSAVDVSGFTIGHTYENCCGCDRSFTVTSSIGGPRFDLVANDTTACVGCCCCNACCINEYVIFSAGNVVGMLTCAGGKRGERHRLTFEADIIDAPSRALLLTVFIKIYDQYFSAQCCCCCGHVGNKGCRYICCWVCAFILPVVFLVLLYLIFILSISRIRFIS